MQNQGQKVYHQESFSTSLNDVQEMEHENEELKENINDLRRNMGYQSANIGNTKAKNIFKVILVCLLIAPVGFYVGRGLRQQVDDNPEIVSPVFSNKTVFYITDSDIPEGALRPEDYMFIIDGEPTYEISSKGEMIVEDDAFEYVSVYSDKNGSYETSKGIKVGDSEEKFFEAYKDYKADYISISTADETITVRDIYIRDFKEKYIDSGKLSLTDPSLDIYIDFNMSSDGKKIVDYPYQYDYKHRIDMSFDFTSNDKYGTDERTPGNTSSGLHLHSMGNDLFTR